jgi:hypothetical protein
MIVVMDMATINSINVNPRRADVRKWVFIIRKKGGVSALRKDYG